MTWPTIIWVRMKNSTDEKPIKLSNLDLSNFLILCNWLWNKSLWFVLTIFKGHFYYIGSNRFDSKLIQTWINLTKIVHVNVDDTNLIIHLNTYYNNLDPNNLHTPNAHGYSRDYYSVCSWKFREKVVILKFLFFSFSEKEFSSECLKEKGNLSISKRREEKGKECRFCGRRARHGDG